MKTLSTVIFLSCTAMVACNTYNEPRHHNARPIHSSIDDSRDSAHYGRVSDIDVVSVESRSSGSGAVVGAVIGGVLGHQVGKGKGRDVATGAGAIGGAVAGNKLEKRNGRDKEIYRVTVNFENGDRREFDYDDIDDLQVGDRVRVENGKIEQL
ncbi:MAG: glycine zipper 2TM domain-containing protein [Gammaproteobacteria bacterium]|nr:MAG: glycine zipper 2TM domain-containing protein [Gammaproteobacteria bacterium]